MWLEGSGEKMYFYFATFPVSQFFNIFGFFFGRNKSANIFSLKTKSSENQIPKFYKY